ncbi:MAG TPA: hypothetical protein VFA11_05485 [Acidimicrobiales bacterium]|nr:hypothetical protein [Acidimicrobiales bacterium]
MVTGEREREQELLDAAAGLRDEFAGGQPISTSRLVNPLLDLWALASGLGEDVTGPIEQLLTVYAGPRDLALPSELAELHERLAEELGRAAMV